MRITQINTNTRRVLAAAAAAAACAVPVSSAQALPPGDAGNVGNKVEVIISPHDNGTWDAQTVDGRQTWTYMTGDPYARFSGGWCAADGTKHAWADQI